MPEIQPFAGIRYRVPDADLPKVLAPPYDVIPPSYQDELYARDPRNIVRVVLNREAGDAAYREAGRAYRSLALSPASSPPTTRRACTCVEQTFEAAGRTPCAPGPAGPLPRDRQERGRSAAARAHARGRQGGPLQGAARDARQLQPDLPDERGPGRRASRRRLASARGASPTAVLHRRRRHRASPVARHRPGRAGRVPALAGPLEVVHRGRAPPLRDRAALPRRGGPGRRLDLRLLHAARFARPAGASIPPPVERGADAGRGAAEAGWRLPPERRAGRRVRGRAKPRSPPCRTRSRWRSREGARWWPRRSPRRRTCCPRTPRPACARSTRTSSTRRCCRACSGLDDSAVRYVHSLAEAEHGLAGGHCRLALLLRATPVRQIVDVAEAGESMPAKSTFFHPKLPSALVIHPLSREADLGGCGSSDASPSRATGSRTASRSTPGRLDPTP